jgi:ribosomal protein S24E
MESKIIQEEKNPFLERTELTLEIKNEVAPSFDEVKTEIGKDAELTIVKKVNTSFGKQVFVVEAVVYDSKEAKDKIETIPQKVRKKMATEAKATEDAAKKAEAEAKAAEEAAAETPAEEPAPEAEAPVEEATPEPAAEETKEEAPAVEPAAEEKTE